MKQKLSKQEIEIERALDAVEKAIDKAFERGKKFYMSSVVGSTESGLDSFGDSFEHYKDIPTKDGYLPYKSNTNGNWFLKRTKDQRIIASFVEKEHLILFLNAI